MKITTEQIRQIIKEEIENVVSTQDKSYGIGVVIEHQPEWGLNVSLMDLDKLAELSRDIPPKTLLKQMRGKMYKQMRDEVLVGQATALSRVNFKNEPGQSVGDLCYHAYEIRTLLAKTQTQDKGYPKELWECFFGATKRENIYVFMDRRSVTAAAWKWWDTGIKNNSAMKTVPPKGKGFKGHEFIGQFDDIHSSPRKTPKTPFDDCQVYPDRPNANKAYQGTSANLKFLEEMEEKTNRFFQEILRPKLPEPGFFSKWLEKNPEKTRDKRFMKKMKSKLIRLGKDRFDNWWQGGYLSEK